jgi:hypothetical protein
MEKKSGARSKRREVFTRTLQVMIPGHPDVTLDCMFVTDIGGGVVEYRRIGAPPPGHGRPVASGAMKH